MNRATIKYRILLLLLAAAAGLGAQDPAFTASAPASVRVGEQFQYVIEGNKQGDVMLPEMKGVRLMAGPFSSYSSHSQWVNGKMSMETVVSYTHILQASEVGSLQIPPATIRVGRKEYKTNAVNISVLAAASGGGQAGQGGSSAGQGGSSAGQGSSAAGGARDQVAAGGENEAVFMRVIPSKKEVYVGEQFTSGLKIYTRVNTRPGGSSRDMPYEGFYKIEVDPDASARRQDIGGQEYISQVLQRHILIPQKSGEIRIDPYESEWLVQQRTQRRRSSSPFDSFFDDPFFGGVQEVPLTLSTPPVTINVKPLPAGAPEGFTGGVGDFSMKAELSASELSVNEALSLKITIRGTGNLPLLGEPEVNLPPDHDVYETTRKINTSTESNRVSGSVVFEFPIVARHAGRFRIAPVRFSWFDPVEERYKSVSSEEFSFMVLKGEREEGQATVYVPGSRGDMVENLGTDIRDIQRGDPALRPLSLSIMAQTWYRLSYLVLSLLAILFVLLMQLMRRRNADLRLVRNRRASKAARQRLRKAEKYMRSGEDQLFYEELGKAIWGYLGDKLGVETSALSRENINAHLEERKVEEEVLSACHRILEESEFSRFAPSSEKSDMNMLYDDAVQLIRNLESKLS